MINMEEIIGAKTPNLNPNAKEFIPSRQRQDVRHRPEEEGRLISAQLENKNQPASRIQIQQYNIPEHPTTSGDRQASNTFYNNRSVTHNVKKSALVDELNKFIEKVTPEPSLFDKLVQYLLNVAKGWMEEEGVPNEVVQKILVSAIFNPEFRYNGVRLCMHLNQDITKEGILVFRKALIENCLNWIDTTIVQEEQNVTQNYTEDLTLFIGDLYSRIGTRELGIGLLRLIRILVSRPDDYRMKVSAQILKLCGQSLNRISSNQSSDSNCSIDYIIRLMETCVTEDASITDNTRALVQSVIHLKHNDWSANYNGHNNHVVPPITNNDDDYGNYETGSLENYEYIAEINGLINDDGENFDQLQLEQLEQNDYMLQGESVCEFNGEQFIIPADEPQVDYRAVGYDFGNSDDEQNDDVCEAFEQFLSNLPDE